MLRVPLGDQLDRVLVEVSTRGRYDDENALEAVRVAWAGPTALG